MPTMTLTLELPDALAQQLKERHIAENDVKAFALAALEVWLAQPSKQLDSEQPFAESAVPFARRLVAENRELFNTLAER